MDTSPNYKTVFTTTTEVEKKKSRSDQKRAADSSKFEQRLKEKHGEDYVEKRDWICVLCKESGHRLMDCSELERCKKVLEVTKEAVVAFGGDVFEDDVYGSVYL